jgi:hypothetical protein
MQLRGLELPAILRLLPTMRQSSTIDAPLHCFLCIADHHEPMWGHAPAHVQQERVDRWVRMYPKSVAGICDSRGRPPQQTFFYPAEEYDARHIEKLAGLCRQGYGDVEVHLHHDNDTADSLRETLELFKQRLYHGHGLLDTDGHGEITYGFIHGNWALANSRPDGRWCGVNNELNVLRESGCYADFTMPSAPDPTQTRMVNSIYYAAGDGRRPKSHDVGSLSRVGLLPPADRLLLIQGPLALDCSRRKRGCLPSLENAALHAGFPPTLARFRLWLRAGVAVAGQPHWIFIKVHTHGAPERNAVMLLGETMRRFHRSLADYAAKHPFLHYYYVTARELADLVHQAEQGVKTPQFRRSACMAQ